MALEIRRGDNETVLITVKDKNGATQDLTGCTLWWEVASHSGEGSILLLSKSTLTGGVEIDPDQVVNKGKAKIAIAPADTSSLERPNLGRELPWELQIKDASGVVATVAVGKIVVKADLVRDT